MKKGLPSDIDSNKIGRSISFTNLCVFSNANVTRNYWQRKMKENLLIENTDMKENEGENLVILIKIRVNDMFLSQYL